jgi:HSP20 family protein
MAQKRTKRRSVDESEPNFGGFLGGLTQLIEKLGDLAETGKELHELGEIGGGEGVRGVYGFTIKTGIGGEHSGGVRVEPFGNVRKDKSTGQAKVHEVLEPMVDVFEEPSHLLVVAEMPGVGQSDVELDVHDDILTIAAHGKHKKYRKEVLLPHPFQPTQMTHSCRNGILEVRFNKSHEA